MCGVQLPYYKEIAHVHLISVLSILLRVGHESVGWQCEVQASLFIQEVSLGIPSLVPRPFTIISACTNVCTSECAFVQALIS